MKKADIYLLITIVAISLGWLLVPKQMEKNNGNQISITIDGAVYGIYSLTKDQKITVDHEDGYNQIIINNGVAWMEEANCLDGYCKTQKDIHKNGQTIICLPNKLVVKVINNESINKQMEVDTISK